MPGPLSLALFQGSVTRSPRVGVGDPLLPGNVAAPNEPASLQPAALAAYAKANGEASALNYVQEQTGIPATSFLGPDGKLKIPWAGITQAIVEKLGLPPGCMPPLNVNGASTKSYALVCGTELAAQWLSNETGLPVNFSRWTNPDGTINWLGAGEDAASAILSYELGAGITVDVINPDGTVNWASIAGDGGAIVGVVACSVMGVTAELAPICGLLGSEIGQGAYVAGEWIAGEATVIAGAVETAGQAIASLFSAPVPPPQPSDQPIDAALAIQGAATWWQTEQLPYVKMAQAYRGLCVLAASMVANLQQENAALLGAPGGFAETVWMLRQAGAVFPPGWTEQLGRTGEGGTWTTQWPRNLLSGAQTAANQASVSVFTEAEFFARYVTPLPSGPTPVFDTLGFCQRSLLPFGLWTPYFPSLAPGLSAANTAPFHARTSTALVSTMYLADAYGTTQGPGVVLSYVGTNGDVNYSNAVVGAPDPWSPTAPPFRSTVALNAQLPPCDWSLRTWTITFFRDASWNALTSNGVAELPNLVGALRDTCLNSWVQAIAQVRPAIRSMSRIRRGGSS